MVTTHTHTRAQRYTYASHEILSGRYIYCFAINLSNKFYFYCSADADCLTDCQLKVGSTVAGEGEERKGEVLPRVALPNWHIYGQEVHERRCQNSKSDKRHLNEVKWVRSWFMPRFIANLKRQQDECTECLECECVRMNVRSNMSAGTSLITFSVIELEIVIEIEVTFCSSPRGMKSGNSVGSSEESLYCKNYSIWLSFGCCGEGACYRNRNR